MSQIIIRLQNLPLTAKAADIREFFGDLKIPKGAVNIVGGPLGDAFIGFASDEDARLAMRCDGRPLHNTAVRLLLSSRCEMESVITSAHAVAASVLKTPGPAEHSAPMQAQLPPAEFKIPPAGLSASMAPLQQTPPKPLNQFLNVNSPWLANFNVEAKVEGADDVAPKRQVDDSRKAAAAPPQPQPLFPQLGGVPSPFQSLQFPSAEGPTQPLVPRSQTPPQAHQHQAQHQPPHQQSQQSFAQQQPAAFQHDSRQSPSFQHDPRLSQSQQSQQFTAPPLFTGLQQPQQHQPAVSQSQPQAQQPPARPAPATNMGESWKSGSYPKASNSVSNISSGSSENAVNADRQFHQLSQPQTQLQQQQLRQSPPNCPPYQRPPPFSHQPQAQPLAPPPQQSMPSHLPHLLYHDQPQYPHSQPPPFGNGQAGMGNFLPPPHNNFVSSAGQIQRPPPISQPSQQQPPAGMPQPTNAQLREHSYEQIFETISSQKSDFATNQPQPGGFMPPMGAQPPTGNAVTSMMNVRPAVVGLPSASATQPLMHRTGNGLAGPSSDRAIMAPGPGVVNSSAAGIGSGTVTGQPSVAQMGSMPLSGSGTSNGPYKATNVPDQNIFNFGGKSTAAQSNSASGSQSQRPKEKSSVFMDDEMYVELTRINAELLMCPSALERLLAPTVPLTLSSVKVIFDRNDHPQYALVRFGCVEDARRVLERNGEKGIRIRNSSRKEFEDAVEHISGETSTCPSASRRRRGGRRRGRANGRSRSRSRSISPAVDGEDRPKRRRSRSVSRSPKRDGGLAPLRICVRLSNVPYRAERKDIEDFVRASRAKFNRIQQIYRDGQDYSDKWVVELSSNQYVRYLQRHARNHILGRPIDVDVISVLDAEAAYAVSASSVSSSSRRRSPSPPPPRRGDRERDRGAATASSSTVPNKKLFSKLPSLMSTIGGTPPSGPDGGSPALPRITLEAKTEEELITRGDLPPAAFGAFSSPTVVLSRSGPHANNFHRQPDFNNEFHSGGPGGGPMGRRPPFSGPRRPFYASESGGPGLMGPLPFHNGQPFNRFGRPPHPNINYNQRPMGPSMMRGPPPFTGPMSNFGQPPMQGPCPVHSQSQRSDFMPQDSLAASLIDALKTQQQQQLLQAQTEAQSQLQAEAAKAAQEAAAIEATINDAHAQDVSGLPEVSGEGEDQWLKLCQRSALRVAMVRGMNSCEEFVEITDRFIICYVRRHTVGDTRWHRENISESLIAAHNIYYLERDGIYHRRFNYFKIQTFKLPDGQATLQTTKCNYVHN